MRASRAFARPPRHPWPTRGWLGLLLVAVFWPLNWALPGLRTHWAFFPLWLGYALTVDAIAYTRRGTSLYARSRAGYVALFVVSAPVWWLFEALNARLGNWEYVGADAFSPAAYAFWATLSFSTVMPAVFGTAEMLAGLTRGFPRWRRGPRVRLGPRGLGWMFVAGGLMLAALWRWPRWCFPLLWVSLYFLVEPWNAWRGHRTLLDWLREGDWRPIAALWSGVLVTAFFWEMWNVRSYPKWVYHVPYLNGMHIFEMPLAGYGGYLPFALELFALYHAVAGLAGRGRTAFVARVLVPPDEPLP